MSVDEAAVATYPVMAAEEERSFLARVMGWMCGQPPHRLGDRDE